MTFMTDKKDAWSTLTIRDQGGVAVRVWLLRGNVHIAEIPIEEWEELDAVKEFGGESWDMTLDEIAALNKPQT